MTPLTIAIGRDGKVILVRILEQDESVAGRGLLYEYEEGGVEIYSDTLPRLIFKPSADLGRLSLCIRGTSNCRQDNLLTLELPTVHEAEIGVLAIKEAVCEYNKSNEPAELYDPTTIKLEVVS